jgi:hypothetical protein
MIATNDSRGGTRGVLRLLDVQLVPEGDHVSLVGWLEHPGTTAVTKVFFRFPADLAPMVGVSADPFLAALLVPAFFGGYALAIDLPVSQRLLRRTTQIQDVLTTWYPACRPIEITAATRRPAPSDRTAGERGVGSFFSGGIDSCYTLIKNHLGWPGVADPITHLIFVKGFDATLAEAEGLAQSEEHIRTLAAQYGRALVVVETNVRDVLEAPWGEMYHGAALAAVGLSLAPGLGTVLIPSSYSYEELGRPWGSHPMLDELWSTEAVQFIHDGSEATRIGKLAALVTHAPSLVDQLRVCYTDARGGPQNCGTCLKCVRTMVLLRAVGHLGKTSSFPAELPSGYAQFYNPCDRVILRHILHYARAGDDTELVAAFEARTRVLEWKERLPTLLRSHPIGAAVLDTRVALVRRWRTRRS